MAVRRPASVGTIIDAGHVVITGGVVSVITVMVNSQEAVLPDVSTADAVTVYMPAV